MIGKSLLVFGALPLMLSVFRANGFDPQLRAHQALAVFSRDVRTVDRDHRKKFIEEVSKDIAKLKKQYPQLSDFSESKHVNFEELKISYAYHTHRAEHGGGWTAGVPNPDPDGVWFYIDLHNPNSKAQIHTQPVSTSLCLGNDRVSFLTLEGTNTKLISGKIWKILERHGATRCT